MKSIIALLIGAAIAVPLLTPVQASARLSGLYDRDDQVQTVVERRKKRVKGGSGCDDAEDRREHAECR